MKNKNGSPVTAGIEGLKALKNERHDLLVKRLRAIDEGDADVAVAADAALRENKVRITAGENALSKAVADYYRSLAGGLPEKERHLSEQTADIWRRAGMYVELAARCFLAVKAGDVAERLRAALEVPYISSGGLTPDVLVNIRERGRSDAEDALRRNPLPDLDKLGAEVEQIRMVSAGDKWAVDGARKRLLNAAMREELTADELRHRGEVERKARMAGL